MSWKERGVAWLGATRLWLACERTRRRARLWLHNLIREEGLVNKHLRVSAERVRRDPELGGTSDFPAEEKTYGFACAMAVAFAVACAVYLLIGLVYVLVNGGVSPELAANIDALGYSALLHVRHDPIADAFHDEHGGPAGIGDLPAAPGPYATLHARIVGDANLTAIVHEPCRRLSRAEILAGITTEGYALPLVLMRMCEIVHEMYGCEEEGILVPKHIVTPDDLNICAITFKERSGVCRHYINPVVRAIQSTNRNEISVSSPHFPTLGMHILKVHPSVLLSYQPIVHAQVAHDAAPAAEQDATQALSDSYNALSIPGSEQWLTELPDQQTLTIGAPDSYLYFIAHSALLGEYPSFPSVNEQH